MSRIVKLDQKVTNLIAAGEVIERVCSVVKELVENAIDANAKAIKVELQENGLKEIIVSDDGIGMDAYDIKNCVLPHYTSKIKNADDLFNINTLGFRGEALPSICAVSNLIIKSSINDGKGIMVRFKDSILVAEGTIAMPKGTTVIVRDLFYNTPARLATLSNGNSEVSYVTDYLTKMAFAYPEIAFIFNANGRLVFQTYGNNDELEVINNVYGLDVAKQMLAFAKESKFFSVEGYTSNISITRSTKSHMTILVNGRLIRSYNITNAIIKGYGTRLMGGKYPVTIIHITTDAGLVDVNVHPAKAEVRFSMEDELIDLVASAINDILENHDLIIEERKNKELVYDDPFYEEEDSSIEENEEIDDLDLNLDYDELANNLAEASNFIDDFPFEEASKEEKQEFIQEQLDLFSNGVAIDTNQNANKLPLMHLVGQLFDTYIVAQGDDNFYLIDQHAAAERINYERIYNAIKEAKVMSYELLVPLTYSYTPQEAIIISSKLDEFKNLGIGIENFGGTTFVVRSVGSWIPKKYVNEYLEEVFTSIINGFSKKKEEFLDNLAKSIACKSAIKGNEYHNMNELENLMALLNKAKNPYTCPHGRPVIVKFSKYEVEKWFKRIV